jgi:hypothetical protein
MKTLDNSMRLLRFKSKIRMEVLVAEREKIYTSKRISKIAWIGLMLFTAFCVINAFGSTILVIWSMAFRQGEVFTSSLNAVNFLLAYLITVPLTLLSVSKDCWNNRLGEHAPRWYRSTSKVTLIIAIVQTTFFASLSITGNYEFFKLVAIADPAVLLAAYLTSFRAEQLIKCKLPNHHRSHNRTRSCNLGQGLSLNWRKIRCVS